ncbi:MAG: UMP kinase [Nanoarchaeota archaeon]
MVKVISLGGSVIVPDEVSYEYLVKFRGLIINHSKKEKIVIVCGGGHTARIYIKPLQKANVNVKLQGLIGIRVTRLNAWLLIDLFKGKSAPVVGKSLNHVKELLKRHKIVISGGLSYDPKSSSDASAVQIANMLNADFINITNVKGVYDKHPKLKGAKFIQCMTFNQLYKMTSAIGFKPGQHGILDVHAASLIKKHNIETYIVGSDLGNLKKILNGKKFVGTIIS